MRNEQEMLDLILGFAKSDERVRAVIMNGSRVNPDVPQDIFQDYDIVYVVTAVEDFVHDRSWIHPFGDLIIMQTPDESMLFPPLADKIIDFQSDSLSVLLLDKDGIVEPFAPPSNLDYLPAPPTAKQFSDCCNEFWWVSTYVAKGLWRAELGYAKYMFDRPVRWR